MSDDLSAASLRELIAAFNIGSRSSRDEFISYVIRHREAIAQALEDLERWQHLQRNISAERSANRLGARFVFPKWATKYYTEPDLMRGSVAQHLTAICDAARKEGA
jgi:hypothetical protein